MFMCLVVSLNFVWDAKAQVVDIASNTLQTLSIIGQITAAWTIGRSSAGLWS